VIYSAVGGSPGPVVAATNEVVVAANAAPAWTDFTFSSAPTLAPGSYWLGYWYGGGNGAEYFDTISSAERFSTATYSSTATPPSLNSATSASSAFSVYLVYTPAGGVPANTAPPTI